MPEQPGAGRLDPETLAAYIDGLLPPEERARVDAEIAADPEAYEWVVNSIGAVDDPAVARPVEPERTSAPTPAPTPAPVPEPAPHNGNGVERKVLPFYRRRSVQGLLGTLLAAAAALVMVVRTQPVWWQEVWGPSVDPRFAKLVAAVGEERYIEARLTGGFKYGPLRQVMRGPGDLSNQNLQLLAAAGELQKAAENDPSAENLHAWGVAQLLLGDAEGAVAALEAAHAKSATSLSIRVDLAAALIARADATGSTQDLPRALEHTVIAIEAAGASSEAKFGHALALEKMGLWESALEAWLRAKASEPSAQWRAEIARHVDLLKAKSQGVGPARQRLLLPDEPCLAAIDQSYREGRMLGLVDSSKKCTSTKHAKAVRLWAAFFEAVGYYYSGRLSDARSTVVWALSYGSGASPDLDGRLLYLLGGLDLVEGRLAQALENSRASLARLPDGDSDGRASAYRQIAEIVRAMGDRDAAWAYYRSALTAIHSSERSVRKHALLNSTGLAALAAGYGRFAEILFVQCLANADGASRDVQEAEAYVNIARASALASTDAGVRARFAKATQVVSALPNDALRARLEAELSAALASWLSKVEPSEALLQADVAVASFASLGIAFRQHGVMLAKARSLRALGRRQLALVEIESALALVEAEAGTKLSRRNRVTHLDRTWEIYQELVDVLLELSAEDMALLAIERGKRWLQPARAERVPDQAITSWLPTDGDVIVQFFVSGPTVSRWTWTNKARQWEALSITSIELKQLAAELSQSLQRDSDPTRSMTLGQRLGKHLLAGLTHVVEGAERLVIVQDHDVSALPFSALVLPGRAAALSGNVRIAIASSLESLISDSRRGLFETPRSGSGRVTLVDAATPSGASWRGARLSGARAEIASLRREFPGAVVLEGQSLNEQSLTLALRDSAIVHYAGHAVVDVDEPWKAALVFAQDEALVYWRPERPGTAETVRAVVVLSACSTAGGPVLRGYGAVSIAAELMGAGAPGVIGTLWDIPDQVAAPVFEQIHRELQAGMSPSKAVKNAMQKVQAPSAVWASIVAFENGRE